MRGLHDMRNMNVEDIMDTIMKKMDNASVAQKYLATSYYVKQIQKYVAFNDIVIFGASETGRQLHFMLKKENITYVRAYCDNDDGKQGIIMDGIQILGPHKAVRTYPNAVFIVTSILYADEMMNQLVLLGMPVTHISFFDIQQSGIGD